VVSKANDQRSIGVVTHSQFHGKLAWFKAPPMTPVETRPVDQVKPAAKKYLGREICHFSRADRMAVREPFPWNERLDRSARP
jgi:hypothetical protein